MKCYKYELVMRSADQLPDRLYLPQVGVLKYNKKTLEVHPSFSSCPIEIEVAEKVLGGAFEDIFKYVGETDLPEENINKVLESAKIKDEANQKFQRKANALVTLIK